MSDQKLPNTENPSIINKAIAHDIVTRSFSTLGATAQTPEELAKRMATTYIEVLEIVTKGK